MTISPARSRPAVSLFALVLVHALASTIYCQSISLQVFQPPSDVAPVSIDRSSLSKVLNDTRYLVCSGLRDDDIDVLNRLSGVEWLDISNSPGLSSQGAGNLKLTKLIGLSVAFTSIGDDGVAAIATNLKRIESLDVSGVTLGARAIHALATMPALARLAVVWSSFSSEDLITVCHIKHLSALKLCTLQTLSEESCLQLSALALTDLDVGFCEKLSTSSLRRLASIKTLRRLCLNNCSSVDDTVLKVCSSEVLSELGLSRLADITDDSLRHLSQRCKALRRLDISVGRGDDDKITEVGIACIGGLSLLTELYVNNRQGLTKQSAKNLLACGELVLLDASGCRAVDDAVLGQIALLPKLQDLSLAFCRDITDSGVVEIARVGTLRAIFVSGCSALTDKSVSALAARALERAAFDGCTNLTARTATVLATCRTLVELNLSQTASVDDAGAKALSKLPALKSLGLAECMVSDEGLRYIADMAKLEVLILSKSPQVTRKGLALLTKCFGLRHLQVNDCPNLDEEDITWLKLELPRCHVEG